MERKRKLNVNQQSTATNNAKAQRRNYDDDDNLLNQAPRVISIARFAESRAAEIAELGERCRTITGKARVFQRLPRDMKRRVMSHDVKRLPRRLQSIAAKEYENLQPKKKRPSRKFRRRPKNLQSEYARRQRKIRWLETHIWHAKRFHMVNKWGYRIPLHATNKCYRSCFRASLSRCLIQDISYVECVEVCGKETDILEGLSHLTSPNVGLTFAAKSCIRGNREVEVILYKRDCYPRDAVAKVSFLWRPIDDVTTDTTNRQLWIWCHTTCTEEVIAELNKVFTQLFDGSYRSLQNKVLSSESRKDSDSNDNDNSLVLSGSTLCTHSTKTIQNSDKSTQNNDVSNKTSDTKCGNCEIHQDNRPTVTLLRDELCRFRLTGPQSTAVLQNILRPSDIMTKIEKDLSDDVASKNGIDSNVCMTNLGNNITDTTSSSVEMSSDKSSSAVVSSAKTSSAKSSSAAPSSVQLSIEKTSSAKTNNPTNVKTENSWWKLHYDNPDSSARCNKQYDWWNKVKCVSPVMLQPHVVVALTVRDPRFIERKTTDENCDADMDATSLDVPPNVCESPLWDADIRRNVCDTQISEAEVNRVKSQLVIPGVKQEIDVSESRIPVLLVQRPGKATANHASYGCGLDIILPHSWARPFWKSLVFQLTRPGGLRETLSVSRESAELCFPDDFPDCEAGKFEAEKKRDELSGKYYRRPPAKCPNYTKLGVKAMFYCPWSELVREWRGRFEGLVAGLEDGTGKDCEDIVAGAEVTKLDESMFCKLTDTIECDGKNVEMNVNVSKQFDKSKPTETMGKNVDMIVSEDENTDENMEQSEICNENSENRIRGSRKSTKQSSENKRNVIDNKSEAVKDDFYVVRDEKKLRYLCKLFESDNVPRSVSTNILERPDVKLLLDEHKDSLVAVKVTTKNGGIPGDFTMICAPENGDLCRSKGKVALKTLQEPRQRDLVGEENRKERRKKRQENKSASKKSSDKMTHLDKVMKDMLESKNCTNINSKDAVNKPDQKISSDVIMVQTADMDGQDRLETLEGGLVGDKRSDNVEHVTEKMDVETTHVENMPAENMPIENVPLDNALVKSVPNENIVVAEKNDVENMMSVELGKNENGNVNNKITTDKTDEKSLNSEICSVNSSEEIASNVPMEIIDTEIRVTQNLFEESASKLPVKIGDAKVVQLLDVQNSVKTLNVETNKGANSSVTSKIKETMTKSGKKQNQNSKTNTSKSSESKTETETKSNDTPIRQLENVIDSGSRLVIGYINRGDYSFLHGHGAGVGFCSLVSLLYHVRKAGLNGVNARYVLVRNSTSFDYKLGELSVIT